MLIQLAIGIPSFIFIALLENCLLMHSVYGKEYNVKYQWLELTYSLISIIMQKLVLYYCGILSLTIYVYNYVNIIMLTNHWSMYILSILIVDLCYYWFHRMGHEVPILWGAHYLHHTPRQYNLSAGMRISIIQGIYQWVFYIPAAVVIPANDLLMLMLVHNIYGLFTHTIISSPLWDIASDYLVTPQYHMIHHLHNGERLNYAGIFTIFDKIFNTYKDPICYRADMIFGIGIKDIGTYEPIRFLQLDMYLRMYTNLVNAYIKAYIGGII